MSSLNSGLLKVRLIEQDYALHADPKTVDALHEGVDALAAQANAQGAVAANGPAMASRTGLGRLPQGFR
jgi:methyl-accepting chemotaxis protein